MKHLYTIILGLLLSAITFSQSITISDGHANVLNNGIYYVNGSIGDPTVYALVNVTNNKTASVALWCKKVPIYSVPGSDNAFCWAGNCFPTTQFISSNAETIAAGATVPDFRGEYYPYLNSGTDSIKYKFYTIPAADSAEFIVVYDIPLGIASNNNKSRAFTINPNPANNFVVINSDNKVNSKQKVVIYNCLGTAVKKINSDSFNSRVNISGLTSGFYFCTLFVNDKKVSTKKLIINR